MAKQVLVVEDSATFMAVMKSLLAKEGYDVIQAVNGEEGLEQARAHHPDLIVSDVVMPGMDGYQFFKELKNAPDTSSIPVLIATTRAKMEDTFHMFNVDAFMPKPFQNDVFLAKVRELLGGAPAGEAGGGAAGAVAGGDACAGKKALVAGPGSDIVDGIVEHLKAQGAETDSTLAGAEVISKVVMSSPDLIVMDVHQDVMAAPDLIKALKTLPQCAATRILVFSRDADAESDGLKDECVSAGADEYLGHCEGGVLPAKLNDALGIVEQAAEADAATSLRFSGVKALVAGSDDNVVDQIVEQLKAEGAEAEFSLMGADIISKSVMSPPGLILMDIHMEGMASPDLIKALKTLPQCADTRILVYSREDNPSALPFKDECLAAGAEDYIGNFQVTNFLDAIKET